MACHWEERAGGGEEKAVKPQGTEESGSVRNTEAVGNRKFNCDSNPEHIYFAQITVSLAGGYLMVCQLTLPARTQLSLYSAIIQLLCLVIAERLPVPGITATSKDRKQGIGPKASL